MQRSMVIRLRPRDYTPPKVDEGDIGKFGTLLMDTGEKTIAVLADKWWRQAVKQVGG